MSLEQELRMHRWTEMRTKGRPVQMVISDRVRSAAVLIGAPPTIALAPALLKHLDDDHLDCVAIHEWAHVQRRDDIGLLVQMLVQVVAGWHPAVWWLDRQLSIEREVACDEIAIGVTGWVGIARQTRAQVLALKEKEFADAARALGAAGGRVLARHIVPNALSPIVVAVAFGIPEAIFTEAALSFIGVGINPPTPSWGQMVGEGQQYIRSYWHLCVFPSIAIAVTMLAFTFFGDGVRDALDPKLK